MRYQTQSKNEYNRAQSKSCHREFLNAATVLLLLLSLLKSSFIFTYDFLLFTIFNTVSIKSHRLALEKSYATTISVHLKVPFLTRTYVAPSNGPNSLLSTFPDNALSHRFRKRRREMPCSLIERSSFCLPLEFP